MKDFYAPSDIKYWPEHMRWGLVHLRELEEGIWPSDPRRTIDDQGHRPKHGAYFEIPVTFAAEINVRVDACDNDGILAKQCLADGWDMLTLAKLIKTDIQSLEYKINRVVLYSTGSRKRRMSYREFSRRHGIRMYQRRRNNGE